MAEQGGGLLTESGKLLERAPFWQRAKLQAGAESSGLHPPVGEASCKSQQLSNNLWGERLF